MLTIVQKALGVQRKTTKRLDGRRVILRRRRGEETLTATPTATIGETRSEDLQDETTILTLRFRDWLIDVIDYDFGDGPVEPEPADEIEYNGESWVVQPTPSEPENRRSDRDKNTWRVHTKKIA